MASHLEENWGGRYPSKKGQLEEKRPRLESLHFKGPRTKEEKILEEKKECLPESFIYLTLGSMD